MHAVEISCLQLKARQLCIDVELSSLALAYTTLR